MRRLTPNPPRVLCKHNPLALTQPIRVQRPSCIAENWIILNAQTLTTKRRPRSKLIIFAYGTLLHPVHALIQRAALRVCLSNKLIHPPEWPRFYLRAHRAIFCCMARFIALGALICSEIKRQGHFLLSRGNKEKSVRPSACLPQSITPRHRVIILSYMGRARSLTHTRWLCNFRPDSLFIPRRCLYFEICLLMI